METPTKAKRHRRLLLSHTLHQKRHGALVSLRRYQRLPATSELPIHRSTQQDLVFRTGGQASSSQDSVQKKQDIFEDDDAVDYTALNAAKQNLQAGNKITDRDEHEIVKILGEIKKEILTEIKSVKKQFKVLRKKVDQMSEGREEAIPANHLIKGRNVMKMPTRDGYQFSLDLLAMLFTREELAGGLCFVNNRSTKPPLDHRKIERIAGLVMERYKDNPVDLKVLWQRMNQKCRDSAPRPVKNVIASGNQDGDDFGEGGHNQDDFSE